MQVPGKRSNGGNGTDAAAERSAATREIPLRRADAATLLAEIATERDDARAIEALCDLIRKAAEKLDLLKGTSTGRMANEVMVLADKEADNGAKRNVLTTLAKEFALCLTGVANYSGDSGIPIIELRGRTAEPKEAPENNRQ